MSNYEGMRRVCYEGGAIFVPVCPICGRFVKADDSIGTTEQGIIDAPNASCKRCGRVSMLFEGFF